MRTPQIILALCAWVSVTIWITAREARTPATDVFLFKEAGVNWAQTGKFQAKNLPHMPPQKEMNYAYYPPLYPLLFGVWTKVTGVGLKQSIVFDSLLRMLRTALLFILALCWARSWSRHAEVGTGAMVLFALAMSLVSSDGDRPDELAIIFGLCAWLSHARLPHHRWWIAAIFLGLCGATSPAGGILFAVGISLSLIIEKRWLILCCTAGIAFLCFVVCNFPFYVEGWSAVARFREQASLSNFPYQAPWQGGWFVFADSWWRAFSHSWRVGGPYLISFALLVVWAGILLVRHRDQFPKSLFLYWALALVYAGLCLWMWTLQPYYFWMGLIPVVAILVALNACAIHPRSTVSLGLLLCMSPIFAREFKSYLHALQRPAEQQSAVVAKTLLETVKPGFLLAVDPDQYFTLRAHREIDNLTYVCPHLAEYGYVYATPRSTRRDRPVPTPIDCPGANECFKLVKDFASQEVFEVLGFETPYFVRGNGGALYQNQCLPSMAASPIPTQPPG